MEREIKLTVDAMEKVLVSVEQSVALINKSGESLLKIKQGANETAEIFISINSAINEQGEVSRTIANNIEQINQQSQHQSEIIYEVKTASEYLVLLASQTNGIS